MPQPARGIKPAGSGEGLTVAVTGPTGEIGKPFVQALERTRDVARILGMARRPFDPSSHGWRKTEYRQGDITSREDVDALVADADVVVHLAFIVLGASDATREINLEGSRNVFRAAVEAKGVERLVYTSSVAAYGFHQDNPQPLDEDVPTRGTEAHPYSAQKAELEKVLQEETDGKLDTYVFRPCIVAGPDARMLIDAIPYVRIGEKLPGVVRALFDQVPVLKPVIPDPGVPFQLVHHDDVAQALKAAVLGKGEPGVYNLAGDGEMTMSDLADALRWYSVPVPDLAVDATAEIVSRIPFLPAEATWVNAGRVPVVMSTEKARRQLKWKPKHDTKSTLRQTVDAARPDLEAGHDDDG
ncbi:MAG TPA: NAD-dependent epimerase/dehydratase family protein [Solirubrobacteraceae bacterium]